MDYNQLKIDDRDRIQNYLKEIDETRRTIYKCCICGEDVTWNAAFELSYFLNNRGKITRMGHARTNYKFCSQECRKIGIPKYYGSYEEFMDGVDIPVKFEEARLRNIYDEEDKQYYQFYLDKIDKLKQGMYISGTIGCGKTYAACALAYELRKRDQTVIFISAQKLVLTANSIGYNSEKITEFLDKYSKYDFIIIDDFYSNFIFNNTGKQIMSMLFLKLYDEQRRIIITSNASIEEVFTPIDERIPSRLKETMVIKKILGKNQRNNEPTE